MTLSILSIVGLGFVLGLKHALDADHLAAVSTMATEKRSLLSSSLIGVWWGIGHTISLLFASLLVMLFHLQIGPRTEAALEFCVGIMLIVLGANALRKLVRGGRVHVHAHEHEGRWHVHPHVHEQKSHDAPHMHHGMKAGARPLLIGMVHGLAGSAALTLLVLATISSSVVGLLYIAVFGVGSIGGMAIMSTVFALPSKLNAERFGKMNFAFRGLAGLASLGLGALTVYQIGVVNLFASLR
jgi:ABC-type nickel/cobalt efflux system permease component RcnA